MGWTAFIILDALSAIVPLWPLWVPLILVQCYFLYMGFEMHRWLPLSLMVVGLLWCFALPIITQVREGGW